MIIQEGVFGIKIGTLLWYSLLVLLWQTYKMLDIVYGIITIIIKII